MEAFRQNLTSQHRIHALTPAVRLRYRHRSGESELSASAATELGYECFVAARGGAVVSPVETVLDGTPPPP